MQNLIEHIGTKGIFSSFVQIKFTFLFLFFTFFLGILKTGRTGMNIYKKSMSIYFLKYVINQTRYYYNTVSKSIKYA